MRLNGILVLLTLLFMSTSATAQLGIPGIECAIEVRGLFWAQAFGRCAHPNPRIAIPACTRQLLDRDGATSYRTNSSRRRMLRAQQCSLRGTAHLKLGNVDQALDDYDRALTANKNLYWIHLARGAVHFAIADDQGALISFNDAVSQAPNSAVALNERARLLTSALDENVLNGQQAIADARSASALAAPGWPDNVAVLASAYAENGEFELAVETQQRAIELLEPGD
jgi:tetratricopeptide (TPR) repeat protein